MKYLKKYNESSKKANDYKFRRDVLPSEIEDILEPLKDESIDYRLSFPRSDLKRIEINIESSFTDKMINKNSIKNILSHLIYFLKTESFELYYYCIEITSISNSKSDYITTPEFSFNEFFELFPENFVEAHFIFTD
jgi:hypothetical protein